MADPRHNSDPSFAEALLEAAPDATVVVGQDGRIVRVNKQTEAVFGYRREELIGQPVEILVPERFRPHHSEHRAGYFSNPIPRSMGSGFELFGRRKDGSEFPAEISLSPAQTSLGPLVLGAIRDVSERQRLNAAQLGLSAIVDSSADAIIGKSLDGTVTSWNRGAERVFGYTASEMVGRSISVLIPPGREHEERTILEHLRRGEPLEQLETVRRRKDGCHIHVSVTLSPVRSASGEVIGASKIARDITDRVRLDEARRRLSALVAASQDAIIGRSRDGLITSWNPGAERIFGYRAEEIVGQSIQLLIPPGRGDPVPLREAHEEPRAAVETVNRTKDGREISVSSTLTWVGSEEVIAISRDVTERKELEEALRQAEMRARTEAEDALFRSRARFARLSESGIVGIAVADLAGNLIEVNDAYLGMLGYTREEFRAGHMNWSEMTPPEWREGDRQAGELLRSKGVAPPREKEMLRKDGTRLPLLVGIAMLDDPHAIAFVVDLSERKRVEKALAQVQEQFRQSQKMEAVGRLAGGVAHDFNNLLSVILTYSEMAIDSLPSGEPLRADLVEIKKAGDRATALTRQLLAFSRQQLLEPRVLNLNDIIIDAEKMLARLIGEDVELTVRPGQTLGSVRADPGQIQQVLMNLAINARDAMAMGGKLTLETANVDLGEEYVREHFGVTPGPYVMLAVSDTGTGMDKPTLAKIFEPFFTTKENGKGTGLGLSTVFGIIQQSQGHIWVYSEPGKGTTFKVFLPQTDEALTPAQSTPDQLTTLRGTETILVVEDEDQIRTVVVTLLRSFGYQVLEARNGGEAMLMAEKHPAKIDLLLTDVVMPYMSGAELAKRLGSIRVEMKVLCMSGYTDEAVLSHGILDAGLAYLQKPITPDKLTRKIREVLAAGAPRLEH